MNSYERIKRMYEHREADRIPILDEPWKGTIRRWHREGMPASMDWCDYFDVDKLGIIEIDISPRMPVKVLEENGGFIFSSDHSIPNSVSLENMKRIVEEVKKVGRY